MKSFNKSSCLKGYQANIFLLDMHRIERELKKNNFSHETQGHTD